MNSCLRWAIFVRLHTYLPQNTTLIRHDDGTYDVTSYNLTVSDSANADVIALAESWDQTTLDGLYANWLVDAVTCIDN